MTKTQNDQRETQNNCSEMQKKTKYLNIDTY